MTFQKTASYAIFGAVTAISENWEILSDAYNNKATWTKALTRTAIDFAGYTATPAILDGVLFACEKKFAIAMKNAGMGYTLGFFLWNAGKEFFSYQLGEIPKEEFFSNMKKHSVRGAEMLAVNVLAYIVSGTGYTFLVPVVIIAGGFAVQRVNAWPLGSPRSGYENKRWLDTVYIDDVRTILGDDLMNAFTLITPERRASLAEPERRANLAEPEKRKSIARP